MNDAFDIEKLLKGNLQNKSKTPPPALFQEIERQLMRKKRRRRFFWILFWFGLGIGGYFTGIHLYKKLNTDCHCPTSEKVTREKGEIIEPDSQNRTPSKITDFEKIAAKNDINLAGITQKEINSILPLEKNNLRKIDSIELNGSHIEALQINDLALSESDNSNKVFMQIKSPKKTIKTKLSETNSHSEKGIEAADPIISQTQDSAVLTVDLTNETLSIDSTLEINPEKMEPQQSENTLITEKKENHNKYGLIAYGGPSYFDIAVFKPYLSSGSLSKRPFQSSGYEFGIGSFKQLNKPWQVNLSLAYNHKQSRFLYDLLVSEEDYFNYYNNDVLIPMEQLDQEESCNCFVANDVQLEYEVNTVSFSLGTSYQLIDFKKINIDGNFNLSTNIFTRFKNNSNSTVSFLPQKTEKFNSLGLKSGFTIGYELTNNTRITLSPIYKYLFSSTKSSFYARPLQEVTVSLGLNIVF